MPARHAMPISVLPGLLVGLGLGQGLQARLHGMATTDLGGVFPCFREIAVRLL